jgi:NADPH-dependent 2,4-dienoyl-CoA reductase/sulfur reductase-like enzyme
VVVVGASAAGVAAVETLGRLEFGGDIVLVGDEPDIAPDRPPLSKQVLAGDWAPAQAALLNPARRAAINAHLLLGMRAVALDETARAVAFDDGSALPFDDLVIATGVRPRTLPGSAATGVHVLRTLDDALSLQPALEPNSHLVIVGAGFLGLEIAATARRRGVTVTVVEPIEHPLATRLGVTTAARLLDLHRAQGVQLRLGIGVSEFVTDAAGTVSAVRLGDGSTVACSTVVVAIGCTPNVEWLAGSSLDTTDGVLCDPECRAAPGIWAAGDVARWHHNGLARLIRIEHRLNASEQGIAVATNLVGPSAPFVPTPFFWTDHYDVKIQVAGVIDVAADEQVDEVEGGGFVCTYRVDGRLIAVLGWNATKAIMPLRRELKDQFHLARS